MLALWIQMLRLLLLGSSMNIAPSVTFYFMKNSLSDISRKCILSSMIRAVPNIGKWVFHEIKWNGITSYRALWCFLEKVQLKTTRMVLDNWWKIAKRVYDSYPTPSHCIYGKLFHGLSNDKNWQWMLMDMFLIDK